MVNFERHSTKRTLFGDGHQLILDTELPFDDICIGSPPWGTTAKFGSGRMLDISTRCIPGQQVHMQHGAYIGILTLTASSANQQAVTAYATRCIHRDFNTDNSVSQSANSKCVCNVVRT